MSIDNRIAATIRIAEQYGQNDGSHHKAWVIDQMCRTLLGPEYNNWVRRMCAGEDGPDTYHYDEGIPP